MIAVPSDRDRTPLLAPETSLAAFAADRTPPEEAPIRGYRVAATWAVPVESLYPFICDAER